MSGKVPYYEPLNGRGFWRPRGWVREIVGYGSRPLGPDGPEAWAKAKELYDDAVRRRAAQDAGAAEREPEFPRGSLGHFWSVTRKSPAFLAKKSPRTLEEYDTAWLRIGPALGSKQIAKITVDDVWEFYEATERAHTPKVRHRAIAKLRTILELAVTRAIIPTNPAKGVRNEKPAPRWQTWLPQEIEAMVAGAEDLGMTGVALCIRLMDECGFAPVDARSIRAEDIGRDKHGPYVDLTRQKTGGRSLRASGLWPISEGLHGAIEAYREAYGAAATIGPILRRHDGMAWRDENHFAKDFAKVRRAVFGAGEKRQAMDIRRTYNVEMELGGASPEERATMMANGLDRDPSLDKTYTPSTIERARKAMEKRGVGRDIRRQIGGTKTGQDSQSLGNGDGPRFPMKKGGKA